MNHNQRSKVLDVCQGNTLLYLGAQYDQNEEPANQTPPMVFICKECGEMKDWHKNHFGLCDICIDKDYEEDEIVEAIKHSNAVAEGIINKKAVSND